MLTFSWKPEIKARDEGIARFRKTGGQPPKGATLVGRWTRADFSGGFDLSESEDPKALTEFALIVERSDGLSDYAGLGGSAALRRLDAHREINGAHFFLQSPPHSLVHVRMPMSYAIDEQDRERQRLPAKVLNPRTRSHLARLERWGLAGV